MCHQTGVHIHTAQIPNANPTNKPIVPAVHPHSSYSLRSRSCHIKFFDPNRSIESSKRTAEFRRSKLSSSAFRITCWFIGTSHAGMRGSRLFESGSVGRNDLHFLNGTVNYRFRSHARRYYTHAQFRGRGWKCVQEEFAA